MRTRLRQWRIPIAAGALILAAIVVARIFHSDQLSNLVMVSAAVVAGAPIMVKAIRALGARVIGIDLLVSIAAIGAIIIGEYWEAAAVTFLFSVGNTLEVATMNKTRSALAELVAVAPDTAVVIRDGEQQEIPAHQVIRGETVVVKHGAKVPVDGVVVAGAGSVDESSITGESVPVEKTDGDRVFAGTISAGGLLQIEATGVGADTALARIIHRVEEAQDAKAPAVKFMDKFAAWYTPGVIVFAVIVAILTGDVERGLTLLVISCPGALVISIPVSIVAGIGRAARDGVLIKGGEYLETAAAIDVVALDKTGTLTYGKPELTDEVVLRDGLSKDDLLLWAARAEAGSEHPLAAAIIKAAEARNLRFAALPDAAESVIGQGVVAQVAQATVLVGNAALMHAHQVSGLEAGIQAAQLLAEQGKTPMLVAVNQELLGVLGVADTVRPQATELVNQLHRAGVKTVAMLTGDTAAVAQSVAGVTGIETVHAQLLPEDKLRLITEYQSQGHTVAMVGDGVNDAPALAAADIGVAMGAAGSAVAIETADIALMGDQLSKFPHAISLAQRTINNMRQNIVIALGTVAVLLVGVLFGGVTMAVGMLVHEASVLIVIANAMRLLRSNPSHTAAPAPQQDAPHILTRSA